VLARALAVLPAVGLAAALTGAVACGGRTNGSAPSDASAERSTVDAGVDSSVVVDGGIDDALGCGFSCDAGDERATLGPCPAAPPAAGAPCSSPSEVCEYGSSWWLECNQVFRCQAGQWTVEYDGTQCPWLDAGGPCPATWAEASAVDAAPPSCPFVTCVYPEGFCGCGVACGGGGGLPHPEITGIFTCLPAVAGCPEPRPLSGAPCDGGSCSYGFGCGCGQGEQCVDGVWQAYPTPPCP